MRKIIFLALLVMPMSVTAGTPVLELQLTSKQLSKLQTDAPVICKASLDHSGDGGDTVERESKARHYTDDEQLVMLSLCMAYVHGFLNGLNAGR